MSRPRGIHRRLLDDLREALRAELGAATAYDLLRRRAPDEELARILERFHQEEREQIERVGELVRALGGRPRRRSLRRSLAARLLAGSTRFLGPRFALRVCQDSESTVSRWYREQAFALARLGELDAARTCEELSRVKALHARTLSAWVENLPAGR